jgi:uncharacterized membrane protein YhhN
MIAGLFPVVASAAINEWAVATERRTLERLTKPLTLALLTGWLAAGIGLQGPGMWFVLALALSLAGDIFLLWDDRFFLAGLFAFALAHLAYLIGFNLPMVRPSLFTFLLAFSLAVLAARVYHLLNAHLPARLRKPVLGYTLLITLMMLSAGNTLFHPGWRSDAALLVSGGAALFLASDLILAFNRFARPARQGRFWNMTLYHFGQIALALGVWLQLGG